MGGTSNLNSTPERKITPEELILEQLDQIRDLQEITGEATESNTLPTTLDPNVIEAIIASKDSTRISDEVSRVGIQTKESLLLREEHFDDIDVQRIILKKSGIQVMRYSYDGEIEGKIGAKMAASLGCIEKDSYISIIGNDACCIPLDEMNFYQEGMVVNIANPILPQIHKRSGGYRTFKKKYGVIANVYRELYTVYKEAN